MRRLVIIKAKQTCNSIVSRFRWERNLIIIIDVLYCDRTMADLIGYFQLVSSKGLTLWRSSHKPMLLTNWSRRSFWGQESLLSHWTWHVFIDWMKQVNHAGMAMLYGSFTGRCFHTILLHFNQIFSAIIWLKESYFLSSYALHRLLLRHVTFIKQATRLTLTTMWIKQVEYLFSFNWWMELSTGSFICFFDISDIGLN